MRFPLALSLVLAVGASSARGQGVFNAFLNGAQEVPPIVTAGTGAGTFVLNANDTLSYYVTFSGLSSAVTMAHIHSGIQSLGGGIALNLTIGANALCGTTVALTAAQKTDLLAGALYVNIHTATNGGGEIRGQIRPPVWAHLTGAQECIMPVPVGVGTFGAIVNPDNSVSWALKASGTAGTPTDLHLHVNTGPCIPGGIAFGLIVPTGPGGGPWTSSGTIPPQPPAVIASLLSGGFYVNMHTTTVPGGAIRGDVTGGTLPPTTAGGCAGVGGAPSIGWVGGPPRLSATGPFAARVSNALAGAPAILIVGGTNSSPFPLNLQTLLGGTGPCMLLNDFPILLSGGIAAAGVCAGQGHITFPSLAGGTIGGSVYLQWVVIDGTGPLAVPAVLSDGVTITFQP